HRHRTHLRDGRPGASRPQPANPPRPRRTTSPADRRALHRHSGATPCREVRALILDGVALRLLTFWLSAVSSGPMWTSASGAVAEQTAPGVPTELVRGDVFFWQSLQAATVL